MRKLFLPFILILLAANVTAQNLDNGSFDNWTDEFGPSGNFLYEEPSGYWATNNLVSTLNSDTDPFVTSETTRVVNGDKALRLESNFLVGFQGGLPVGGLAGVGKFEFNFADQFKSYREGMPYTDRPSFLTGYYIYEPVDINDDGTIIKDGCEIYTYLTKFTNGKRDTIGFAYFSTEETNSEYKSLSLPFEYLSDATPDTMFTVFAASKGAAPPLYHSGIGTVLIVDDFSFDFSTGISIPITPKYEMNLYPNPTTNFLNLYIKHSSVLQLEVFDVNGRLVLTRNGLIQNNIIDVKMLSVGNYTYRINEFDTVIGGGQFIVK